MPVPCLGADWECCHPDETTGNRIEPEKLGSSLQERAVAWRCYSRLPRVRQLAALAARQSPASNGYLRYTRRPNREDLSELIKGCDLLVLPTSPDIVSILPKIDTVKALGHANYLALITIVPLKPSKDEEAAQAELHKAGYPLYERDIWDRVGP